jgi:peptidoglycan/xylan/chitin deacetylase (PgdA/CDA1 family)
MGNWFPHAARWAMLSVLLLLAAVVPDTGLIPTAPYAAGIVVQGIAADEFDEPNGLIAQHTARPAISVPSTQDLILGELHPSKAPLPSGPVTYVPILLYHYIRINPNPRDRVGYSLSTPPAMFRAQMQYLADHGFHVISLHQAVVAIKNHSSLPSRPVVLTFDDGYADFFTAAIPIMRSHGFTATDFVISGRMGWSSFMTPSQVVAADSMGFTIGAHTVDHVALAALAPARASWEIRQSKLALEGLLGHPVLDFAYPYGSYNGYDMAQAKSLGFECAVSTLYGTMHSAGQLYYLSRERLGGGLSLGYFASVVGGPPPTAAEIRSIGAAPTAAPAPTATNEWARPLPWWV